MACLSSPDLIVRLPRTPSWMVIPLAWISRTFPSERRPTWAIVPSLSRRFWILSVFVDPSFFFVLSVFFGCPFFLLSSVFFLLSVFFVLFVFQLRAGFTEGFDPTLGIVFNVAPAGPPGPPEGLT